MLNNILINLKLMIQSKLGLIFKSSWLGFFLAQEAGLEVC